VCPRRPTYYLRHVHRFFWVLSRSCGCRKEKSGRGLDPAVVAEWASSDGAIAGAVAGTGPLHYPRQGGSGGGGGGGGAEGGGAGAEAERWRARLRTLEDGGRRSSERAEHLQARLAKLQAMVAVAAEGDGGAGARSTPAMAEAAGDGGLAADPDHDLEAVWLPPVIRGCSGWCSSSCSDRGTLLLLTADEVEAGAGDCRCPQGVQSGQAAAGVRGGRGGGTGVCGCSPVKLCVAAGTAVSLTVGAPARTPARPQAGEVGGAGAIVSPHEAAMAKLLGSMEFAKGAIRPCCPLWRRRCLAPSTPVL
jgi:hypothetical protein